MTWSRAKFTLTFSLHVFNTDARISQQTIDSEWSVLNNMYWSADLGILAILKFLAISTDIFSMRLY
jgi:hypothetical protein